MLPFEGYSFILMFQKIGAKFWGIFLGKFRET